MTVLVPVLDQAAAKSVTQCLQEATTLQKRIGAWVVRQWRPDAEFSGQVRIDFVLQAESEEDARSQALEWTRNGLARGSSGARACAGTGIPNVGEPTATAEERA